MMLSLLKYIMCVFVHILFTLGIWQNYQHQFCSLWGEEPYLQICCNFYMSLNWSIIAWFHQFLFLNDVVFYFLNWWCQLYIPVYMVYISMYPGYHFACQLRSSVFLKDPSCFISKTGFQLLCFSKNWLAPDVKAIFNTF